MEHLWSRAGATGGNRWQMEKPKKRLKEAKTVAMGCDRLPFGAHGKEGSTVRVRQRALKSPQNADFSCQQWYNRAPP